MIRLVKTPALVRKLLPKYTWSTDYPDQIHLTFDDGPNEQSTHWILDQLDQYEAKATFFCVGQAISQNGGLVKELIKKGHAVGNHTYSHRKATKLSADEFSAEVRQCDEALDDLSVSSQLFRPPYGVISRQQAKAIPKKNIVFWSHLGWDFISNINTMKISYMLGNAAAGSIVLLHDNEKSFGNLQKMLVPMLESYKERGLKMTALI
ncbi:MAG: polysaccharide deacetylase family protein [Bacteroidota bacterium]